MADQKLITFRRFAWFALAYNIVVILWGVFLRASYSGDGCGQHWFTCHGEAIPSAPELKTLIEFSHRVTSALAGLVVFVLAGWAFSKYRRGHRVRLFAFLSLLFIVIEGAIGGGLVLTGNTASNWTPTRPYWTAGHLVNTFILLAFLALTAWFSSGSRDASVTRVTRKIAVILAIGCFALVLTSISGSMASLAHMLFPSESIVEGIAKDFDPGSHPLLRLRILHPLLSIFTAVLLLFIASWVGREFGYDVTIKRFAKLITILVVIQVAFGSATLLTLAPIAMQIGHLLLADTIWISFVLLSASVFSEKNL